MTRGHTKKARPLVGPVDKEEATLELYGFSPDDGIDPFEEMDDCVPWDEENKCAYDQAEVDALVDGVIGPDEEVPPLTD